MVLRSGAKDVRNLARLERIEKVGEPDLRQQGLLTDTYPLFGNEAEGAVAVKPEAVFHDCDQPVVNVCRA